MSRAHGGALAIAGVWGLLFAHARVSSAASPLVPPTPTMTVPALEALAVQVTPMDRSRPLPMFVALHGQCEMAEDTCDRWATAVGDRGFLVCPRGNLACAQGGATWWGPKRADSVFLGMEAARLAHPGEIDVRSTTLMGFSLGAPVALGLASHALSGFKGLVLVASLTVEPDGKTLASAGIERVLLAAGELDMSLPHMRALEARLRHDGMPTRFVSLGKVAHVLPPDLGARMGDALAWVEGEGPP